MEGKKKRTVLWQGRISHEAAPGGGGHMQELLLSLLQQSL